MNTNKRLARRRSAQRERIYRIVAAHNDHPTAIQVHDRMRWESPGASLGNVYRNLSILAEEGRLARKRLRDGLEHFDAIISPHSHFICERCGAVSDLKLPLMDDITAEARRRTKHDIKGHTIEFYGICVNCTKAAATTKEVVNKPTNKKGDRPWNSRPRTKP